MKTTASILTIGSELLKGSVLNTNARFLGRELTELGFHVKSQQSCGDSRTVITKTLGRALSQSDLVILSGGLGPTPDDVTRDAIADFFHTPLIFSKTQYDRIKKYYLRRKRQIPDIVRREAMFPQIASPLVNRFGIALGFSLTYGRSLVVVLPGVPAEMERMFHELVGPLIKRHFRNLKPRPALIVKIVGLSEPDVMEGLGQDFFRETFDFGIYPEAGEVSLRIQASESNIIHRCQRIIQKGLGASVYAYEDISLSESIGRILTGKKKTLAVVESCTGGLIASEITKAAGASRYFKGGMTLYDNRVKEQWFRTMNKKDSTVLLKKKGAVSMEIAKALAEGIRTQMQTSFGIGITGIAGPSGGSRGKPVGLVFMAIASAKKVCAWKHFFLGNRSQIQIKAMKKALEYLWREIHRA